MSISSPARPPFSSGAPPTLDTHRLREGQLAPDFKLEDASGRIFSLRDFHRHKTIFFFYPAALTPGCTREACDFRDNWELLYGAGYTIVGVSRDPAEKLAEFQRLHSLEYLLLSDPEAKVHQSWGAWGEKVLYGKHSVGVLRSTVAVDEKGIVMLARYNVKATGHVDSLLRALKLEK